MTPLFGLPGLQVLLDKYPCREHQIRSLAALLHPNAIPTRNVVVYGTEATGKTAITLSLLESLASHTNHISPAQNGDASSAQYAVVNSAKCITPRHFYESIVSAVAAALGPDHANTASRRVETLAQLDVELCKMLKYVHRGTGWKFVLVLDQVDKQRDAPPFMMAGLARLSEIIPCLTTVFIVTSPTSSILRTTTSPHVHFPPYSKHDYIRILALTPPPPIPNTTQQEISELWTRFCAALYDSMIKSASRSLTAFRQTTRLLWPRFIQPVKDGKYEVKEFSKLLVAGRAHFQDESLLNPSIVAVRPSHSSSQNQEQINQAQETAPNRSSKVGTAEKPAAVPAKPSSTDLSVLLPTSARLLLLCAYLASHNSPRHDITLFSTTHTRQRRRRATGGATARTLKHRKIAKKLLGAHAFVLERMLAIFEAVRGEWLDTPQQQRRRHGKVGPVGKWGLDGDLGIAMATLLSLRLLVRVGGGSGGMGLGGGGADVLDRGGKWRVNVGWEVIRGLGRSMGVEVEEWLIE